jgi:hypothetical protein
MHENELPDGLDMLEAAGHTIEHLTDHLMELRFSSQQLARIVALLLLERSVANGGAPPKAELATAHEPGMFHIASEHECSADEATVEPELRRRCVERVEYHEGKPQACKVCGPELAKGAAVLDPGLGRPHGMEPEDRN